VSCEISVSGESSPSEIAMTPHRDPARHFEAADANWDLLGGGRPEAASRMTGGLGWSRGPATPPKTPLAHPPFPA
jgi:hypothetical protein